MLQLNAVSARTLDLLRLIGKQSCLNSFYLVGGTSLALQIGHRLSYDFDFFSATKEDLQYIENELLQLPNIVLKNTSNYALFFENIKLANIKDIAAMKLKTIMNRGSKRDFYDIYFLLQHFTLTEMMSLFERKYANINTFAILRSLTYYEDEEVQPDIVLLKEKNLTWEQVKQTIKLKVNELF